MTGVLILIAFVGLIGLGFGCCWVFVARPLRARADAADGRADEAARSLAQVSAQLEAERRKWRAAAADLHRRIEAANQQLRAEQEQHDLDRREWDRERRSLSHEGEVRRRRHVHLQRAGRYDGQSDSSEGDSGKPMTDDQVTVIRLGLSFVIDDPSSRIRRADYDPAAARRVRLVIERKQVTVRAGRSRTAIDVLDLAKQAQENPSAGDQFVDAACEYAASRLDDPAWQVLTQRWVTRDPADINAVSEALNRSDEWLHNLAGKPFEVAASELGLDGPEAAVIGGIVGNLVLASASREIQGAIRFCEIVGIVIGLAVGLPPLAIACTKSLLHAEIHNQLTAAIKKAFFHDPSAITVDRHEPPGVLTTPSQDEDWRARSAANRARLDVRKEAQTPGDALSKAVQSARNPAARAQPGTNPGPAAITPF
jgi:hypothetical protein